MSDQVSSRNQQQAITDPANKAASSGSGSAPSIGFAPLVPEFLVSNLDRSLAFWRDLLGFEIAYDRPAARFAYLCRRPVQIMLCEVNGRWETGPLERPYGRGINFQIMVDRIEPLLEALTAADWPLFEEPSESWYRVGGYERGQREFLVQEPDVYLLRFAEMLGNRPATM
jgi:catechol 2,3-dioxygenase-like lactoylglutathione lyase family enzyme